MTAYTHLSRLYDRFLPESPYRQWYEWISQHVQGLNDMDVADVGCGTGQLAVRLARVCRRVYGVDVSEEMLAEAAALALRERVQVDWLAQDMRELRLRSPVQMVLAVCDSLNYLLAEADVKRVFAQVYGQLLPGGWWCFDILGPARVHRLRAGIWYDIQDDAAVLFESDADERTGIVRYEVHLFHSEDGETYKRYEEYHEQRYYGWQDVEAWLKASGFQVTWLAGDFGATPLAEADRICIVARKPEQ